MAELTPLPKVNIECLQRSTSEQDKARNRSAWALRLFARFEAASGKPIDEPGKTVRRDALIAELHLAQYSERQAKAAEKWIMRERTKYGTLTLADFFPSAENLALIEFDLQAEIEKAERRGYRLGHAKGRLETERESWKDASPLTSDERMELEYLRGLLTALREEFDQWKHDDLKRKRVEEIRTKFTHIQQGA